MDWENLLEEIEDMARSDLKACISYLAVILEHLYKRDNFKHLAGGEPTGRSWIRSVNNARRSLELRFKRYPSLRAKLPHYLYDAWAEAKVNL